MLLFGDTDEFSGFHMQKINTLRLKGALPSSTGGRQNQQPQLPSANMADADLDIDYIRCPCNYEAPIPGVRGLYTSEIGIACMLLLNIIIRIRT